MYRLSFIGAALAVSALTVAPAHAQGNTPQSEPPAGLAPSTGAPFPKGAYKNLDSLPDWGGIWFRTFSFPPPGSPPPPAPKLKGKYKERYQAWVAEAKQNNGVVKSKRSNCSPPGMPLFMQLPQYPYEFLFTPGRVTINQEAWMQTRKIWTDGRAHPEDPDPSYFGQSIGRWENNKTLVVETRGVSEDIDFGLGMPHSDKMRIFERIGLKEGDPDTLVAQLTVDDPEALEEPFTTEITYKRDRYGQLIEFQCSENDRNPVDAEGNTAFH